VLPSSKTWSVALTVIGSGSAMSGVIFGANGDNSGGKSSLTITRDGVNIYK
jgi:hypothetical protein